MLVPSEAKTVRATVKVPALGNACEIVGAEPLGREVQARAVVELPVVADDPPFGGRAGGIECHRVAAARLRR